MDFKTKSTNRSLIHSIAKYSTWKPVGISERLNNSGIYAQRAEWERFVYFSLLSLGVCFTVAGVIFFFAFNWAELHKFVKLGIVQGALAVCIGLVLLSKIDQRIKDVALFGACVLVGALFAVFGQIYQTGANAYDFFLGWTVFTALWVFVSKYPPLWLFFLVLINGTYLLYINQVSSSFSFQDSYNVLFAFNAVVIIALQWMFVVGKITKLPSWLIRIIALAAIYFITVSLSICIVDKVGPEGIIALLLAVPVFYLAIREAFKTKDVFYLCIIPLSVIVVICSLIIRASGSNFGSGIFLLLALFVIGSVSFQIKQVIELNKKWNGTI